MMYNSFQDLFRAQCECKFENEIDDREQLRNLSSLFLWPSLLYFRARTYESGTLWARIFFHFRILLLAFEAGRVTRLDALKLKSCSVAAGAYFVL